MAIICCSIKDGSACVTEARPSAAARRHGSVSAMYWAWYGEIARPYRAVSSSLPCSRHPSAFRSSLPPGSCRGQLHPPAGLLPVPAGLLCMPIAISARTHLARAYRPMHSSGHSLLPAAVPRGGSTRGAASAPAPSWCFIAWPPCTVARPSGKHHPSPVNSVSLFFFLVFTVLCSC